MNLVRETLSGRISLIISTFMVHTKLIKSVMEKQKIRIIRKEIAQLINSIKEHSDNIGERESIPQLEVDLILKKIEALHERAIIFNYLNLEECEPEKKTAQVNLTPEAPLKSKVDPVQDSRPEPITPRNEESKESAVIPEEHTPDAQKSSVSAEMQIRSTGPSLNEKVAREDNSLAAKLQRTPVSDLVRAIGINQRFTFIQELFNNDSKAFAEAVKHLNGLGGLEEAEEFLFKTLVPQLKWDTEENPVVQEFIILVQRRFS